jgi:hypothetical protein
MRDLRVTAAIRLLGDHMTVRALSGCDIPVVAVSSFLFHSAFISLSLCIDADSVFYCSNEPVSALASPIGHFLILRSRL